MKGISLAFTFLAAAVLSGCTVHQTEAPPLTTDYTLSPRNSSSETW